MERSRIKIRRFPLEAEAIARMGQHQLSSLSYADLLSYAQQSVLLLSQLRHYSAELITAVEELGYEIESDED